ncbi:hypothetical protein FRB99_002735, partial [Tulasnella sp. 403]
MISINTINIFKVFALVSGVVAAAPLQAGYDLSQSLMGSSAILAPRTLAEVCPFPGTGTISIRGDDQVYVHLNLEYFNQGSYGCVYKILKVTRANLANNVIKTPRRDQESRTLPNGELAALKN